MKAKSRDSWRNYFQGLNSSIFEIIDHAILVAAIDHPKELRLRRGQIAEKLYSCHWTQCCGHDHNELAMPKKTNNDNLNDECVCGRAKSRLTGNAGDLEIGGGKQTKVGSSRDDHAEMKMSQVNTSRDDHAEMKMSQVDTYTYSEAEALTDEIDEENESVGEVIRIKEILDNSEEESETVLFESLRRLQLMVLSVEVLQTTKIGKVVNSLRGHRSKQISQFARTLVDSWKIMAKDWIDAAAAIAEGSTDSNPPTVVDKQGLPSPPLDEGVFFASQTPIELSRFFDDIDDDGNPNNSMENDKNHERGREHQPEKQNYTKQKPQLPKKTTKPINEKKYQLIQQESVNNLTGPSNTESWPGRSQKLTLEQKVNNEMEFQNSPYKKIIHKSPSTSQRDKRKLLDDVEVQAKLEATKRKLQEGYQQAEKARNQRRTQFMEFDELPKQELGPRTRYLKRKNYFRHGANGRHNFVL